ncbi:MAG: hypothetical protein COA51_00760 [Idiomarina sp.]|nr:MAG: hypothetical protein COA51_00760 [Idiomarina sp.]
MISVLSLQEPSHKQKIAAYFSRAAQSYQHHNGLQRWCAAKLLDWLPVTTGVTADIGCGPAVNTDALLARTNDYIGLDIAAGMLSEAQRNYPSNLWLRADLEQLPFGAASIDTIYANLAVQWADDLAATLNHWLQAVRPSGCIVASTVLAGSLLPLADYFKQYTGAARHNRFYTAATLQHILSSLDGVTVQFEVEQVTVPYQSVRGMLYDLKGIGANYQPQPQQALTKKSFSQVETAMEAHRTSDGALPLMWTIGFIKLTKD